MDKPALLCFDSFRLDFKRHRLYRDSERIILPESAIKVLEILVANSPEVVDKTTLMDGAWPDTAVVPDNLVQAIHSLRIALGGDAREPRFIRTVHRRGYCFVAQLGQYKTEEEIDPDPEKEPVPSKPTVPASSGLFFKILVGLLIAVILVAVGILILRTGADTDFQVKSIAVLPMANLSGDPDQEYFADGMTDALITELARNEGFDVISRTSVMKFKNTRLSVPSIAARLGVDAIVEGTVTRANGRIRIIAQLVDSRDHHIWGENYESDDQDILRLQRNLAQAVAREIGVSIRLQRSSSEPPLVNPAAHDIFLRGKYVLRNRNRESFLKAEIFFSKSIEIDPQYAPAYAGLADTCNLLANYGFSPSPPARSRAREMAEKAIEIDPGLAEAHLALAQVLAEYDWNFEGAEVEFNKALRLRSSSAEIRSRHAQLLLNMGDLSRALDEIEFAGRLDPLSEIINSNAGWFYFVAGNSERGEERLREVLSYSPDFGVAWYYLGTIHDSEGQYDEAIAELEKARSLTRNSGYCRAALAHALARFGRTRKAEEILNHLVEESHRSYLSPIALAVASFGLDRPDDGFLYLEQAYKERKGWLLDLRVEPVLNPFRSDPRYLDLVRRIGLPPLQSNPPAE